MPSVAPPSKGDCPCPNHHSKTFHELLGKMACACGNPACRDVLQDYYLDSTAPYPNPEKPQLIITLNNPSSTPTTRKKKQAARRQQVFDRAVKLLCAPEGSTVLRIAIHHLQSVFAHLLILLLLVRQLSPRRLQMALGLAQKLLHLPFLFDSLSFSAFSISTEDSSRSHLPW